MAEKRKAHFQFNMNPEVLVTNKQGLSRLASKYIHDAMFLAHKSLADLSHSIVRLERLDQLEDVLLREDRLVDPRALQEEKTIRQETLALLKAAQKNLITLRASKIETARQMEEDLDSFFPTPAIPVTPTPSHPVTTLSQPNAEVVLPVAPPSQAAEPGPAVLNIDPVLLEKARQEMLHRLQELPKKEISGPSVGSNSE